MFAKRLICWWIGALGLAAGAFCQTYLQFSVDLGVDAQTMHIKDAALAVATVAAKGTLRPPERL